MNKRTANRVSKNYSTIVTVSYNIVLELYIYSCFHTMTSGKRFLSVDVECVATGIRHDAREVCYVSVVDADEKILLSKKVKPEKPVVSYLTPLTGIRKGDLDNGEKLLDVIAEVKSLLGPDVVLVGQRIKSDINWLQLQQGTDFAEFVELAEMFKTYNRRYGSISHFTLSLEANTLIRPGIAMQVWVFFLQKNVLENCSCCFWKNEE